MIRVQRKRTKGFKLPPNTLVVTRGTGFGNSYKVQRIFNGYEVVDGENRVVGTHIEKEGANKIAVYLYKQTFSYTDIYKFIKVCERRDIQNIACFCPLDIPCHSDFLIEVWEDYQKGFYEHIRPTN